MSKPKIRFKGYEEDWEQRKLSDITLKIGSGKTPSGGKNAYVDDGIPLIRSQNINNDRVDLEDIVFIDEETDNSMENSRVFTDDVLLNITGASIGRSAVYRGKDKANVNQHVCIIRPTKDFDSDFIQLNLASNFGQKQIDASQAGGGREGLNFQEIGKMSFMFPSNQEQMKIGVYFNHIDYLITLHQRKCEETKKLKKYMLQKMFPQNGKRVPEIRFVGFTEDWEQRKFGNVTELKSASRVHKEEWTTSGVPFYRSSDVMAAINGTENEKVYISEALYEKLSSISGKLEAGDVLVTGGGSVGKPYIVPNNEPLYTKDADLLWIKNQGKFHPYFLYEFFFTPTFRSYLSSISHVGTIAHYTITQLSETPICLPSVGEQQKIGDYFYNIDHLITLHQRKYEELQKIKKFMLQNMFI